MKKQLTYVLMVSTSFPKGHLKEGEPTFFSYLIKYRKKLHTIRSNYELWKKRFDNINKGKAVLSLRSWSGKPYNSKQIEIGRFDCSHGIGLEKLEWVKVSKRLECIQDNQFNSFLPNISDIKSLAQNDGLTYPDFRMWFDGKIEPNKPMAIIHFTEFRYITDAIPVPMEGIAQIENVEH